MSLLGISDKSLNLQNKYLTTVGSIVFVGAAWPPETRRQRALTSEECLSSEGRARIFACQGRAPRCRREAEAQPDSPITAEEL